jgi:Family of unknown function (DUF6505)
VTLPHKLLRTIRLDPSDGFVFDPAAAPGEWAVPGGFMFWDRDPRQLTGRARQAFRSGFLGLTSFGWSTLVVVVEATDDEREAAVAALAQFLLKRHGAPSLDAATAAAAEEIAFAAELATHPAQTLIALNRAVREDGWVSEQFRTLHTHADAKAAAQMPCSAGAFAIVADDAPEPDAQAAGQDMGVDLLALARVRSAVTQ